MLGPDRCPDDNAVTRWLEGRTDAATGEAIRRHADRCTACKQWLAALSPELETDATTTEIAGRYELRQRIGAGAMGAVYAAFDRRLGREVAVKLVRPDAAPAAREELGARILREARALARLAHPNVLAVFDAGVHDDAVFLATELVRGRDVRAWLAANAPSPRAVVDVFVQAARGLAAAHSAGIVHRDVKPDNILVGDDGRVRLADFGLARGAPAPGGAEATASFAGTPAYLAPELYAGVAPDERSDQFALCVSLFEAVYGARPFAGATATAYGAEVRAGRRARAPDPPGLAGLGAVIARGLEPDPDRRFPSVADLADALERIATGATRRQTARRRVAIGAVASAVAIAAALAGTRGRPAAAPGARAAAGPDAALAVAAHFAAHAGPAGPPALPAAAGPDAGAAAIALPGVDASNAAPVAVLLKRARERLEVRDGPGCIAALDAGDLASPLPPGVALVRASCEMLAGQCERGVATLRAALAPTQTERELASTIRNLLTSYCPAELADTRAERIARLYVQVNGDDDARCAGAAPVWAALADRTPDDADDGDIGDVLRLGIGIAQCQARLGRCADAIATQRRLETVAGRPVTAPLRCPAR